MSPEEVVVDLASPEKIFQLFQSREIPAIEILRSHVDPLEKIIELSRPSRRVPPAPEIRKVSSDFLE